MNSLFEMLKNRPRSCMSKDDSPDFGNASS